MTYKMALAGIPIGGGKSVIIGDPATDKTEALLEAFGRAVEGLGGAYIGGPDVGTTSEDMAIVRRRTAHVRGLPGASGDTAPATAWGIFHAMRAAVQFKHGRGDLKGLTVAVQGLGGVGGYLCQYLHAAGCALTVADIKQSATEDIAGRYGATVVDADSILEQTADILAPCALGGVLNDASIPKIKASIVCGGANNQLAEDRHGAMLAERGILYAPDYAVNAGGTINATREGPGYDKDKAMRAVEGIYQTTLGIFARADELGVPTNVAADGLAEELLASVPL